MNYNDLRKLKYAVVINAYHDSKLAYKAREWSIEKIERELGLKLPGKIPEINTEVSNKPKTIIPEARIEVNSKAKTKKVSKSKEYNDLREIKYRTVKNAYQDINLAQKARSWSAKRIEYELGLKLPNNIPKLRKTVSNKTKKQKARQLKKYQILRDELLKYNISKQEAELIASKNKNVSYKKLSEITEDYKFKYYDVVVSTNPKGMNWVEWMTKPKSERTKLWSKWAKNGSEYPLEISNLATYFNRKKGLVNEHHTGWAIVYQAFINNQDPNKLAKYFTIDPFLPEMYVVEVQAYMNED